MPVSTSESQQPQLRPAQIRVANRLLRNRGVLAYHSTGSGKTRTALNAAKVLGLPTDIVVPATTIGQWKSTADEMGLADRVNIQTYDMAMKDPNPKKGLVIVDEAHNFGRNGTKRSQYMKALENAQRVLLLTATPYRNDPSEIAPLLSAMLGNGAIPTDPARFNALYYERPTDTQELHKLFGRDVPKQSPVGARQELAAMLKDKIDYFNAQEEEPDMFPSLDQERVEVPMSKNQWRMYRAALGKLPISARLKLMTGMKFNADEARRAVAFLTSPRQISNNPGVYTADGSIAAEDQPKVETAYRRLLRRIQQDPNARAVVYSAFKGGGIDSYMRRMDAAGIPYGKVTGDMSKARRKQLRDDYNAGKLKAMFITSAGSEGLDLHGTRLVQVLEPHWHDERVNQVIGRASRYGSHLSLPEADRNVHVERYVATPPGADSWFSKVLAPKTPTADQILENMSKRKEERNAQFRKLLMYAAQTDDGGTKMAQNDRIQYLAKTAARMIAKQAAVDCMPIKTLTPNINSWVHTSPSVADAAKPAAPSVPTVTGSGPLHIPEPASVPEITGTGPLRVPEPAAPLPDVTSQERFIGSFVSAMEKCAAADGRTLDKEAAAAWMRKLLAGKLSNGGLESMVRKTLAGAPSTHTLPSGLPAPMARFKDVAELAEGLTARAEVLKAPGLGAYQKRHVSALFRQPLRDLRGAWRAKLPTADRIDLA